MKEDLKLSARAKARMSLEAVDRNIFGGRTLAEIADIVQDQ